jgi:hypothetical protein
VPSYVGRDGGKTGTSSGPPVARSPDRPAARVADTSPTPGALPGAKVLGGRRKRRHPPLWSASETRSTHPGGLAIFIRLGPVVTRYRWLISVVSALLVPALTTLIGDKAWWPRQRARARRTGAAASPAPAPMASVETRR